MSAWIVSKECIDVLVSGAIIHRVSFNGEPVTRANANAVGLALWRENVKSVNWRYNDHDRAASYEFTAAETGDGFLLMQLGCYDYQSCEHPGWKKSAAYACCEALARAIEATYGETEAGRVPDALRAEYDAAPWRV